MRSHRATAILAPVAIRSSNPYLSRVMQRFLFAGLPVTCCVAQIPVSILTSERIPCMMLMVTRTSYTPVLHLIILILINDKSPKIGWNMDRRSTGVRRKRERILLSILSASCILDRMDQKLYSFHKVAHPHSYSQISTDHAMSNSTYNIPYQTA